MELITTYPAAVNSKATVTMGVLDQATTIVEVLDATVLPEAPNLLVLGTDQTAETVLMTARENNTLTIQRAVQGIAKSWPAGTQIARNFTGKDWDDMRSNVEAIVTKILGLTASDVGARPDTWMPTASDVGAFVDYSGYGFDYFATNDTTQWNKSGCYSTSIDSTGLPNGCDGWGTMFIFSSSERGRITQIFFPWNGIGGKTILYYRIYSYSWSEWREINDTSKFLPLDGSVAMSGALNLGNGLSHFNSFNYGTLIDVLPSDLNYNKRFSLWLKPSDTVALAHSLNLFDGENNKEYTIFGEHNKPSGSYTGNGSSATRTIDIGGVGNILYITSPYGFGFVTADGGFFIQASYDTSSYVVSYSSSYIKFVDGVLTIKTSNSYVNSSSYAYTYRVL